MWLGLALGLATVFAYGPALRAGFIWNDPDYVTRPALRSLEGLWRIWTEVGATEQYYPLLHSFFWLQHQLWGDAPAGYHLANVLLHWGSACLFALLLRRLAVPGAWLAGAVFALHPVTVESVAWVAEQKNTLSLFFFLAAALLYLRYETARSAGRYAAASLMYGCALLSKSLTATLPAALLVLAWWRTGRLDWRRDARPLVPWFAVGAAVGLFTAWVERAHVGAEGGAFELGFAQRVLVAGRAVWFYLGTLAWPADLIFIYPSWKPDPAVWWQWLFPAAVVAALAGFWVWRGRSRAPLAAALLFGGTLFPVLGFFNLYGFAYSYVADHWQYLPCLAPIALTTAGAARLSAGWHSAARIGAALVLLGTLATLTWRQSRLYHDLETLYRGTLARNPACWMAHNNLGSLLLESGRTQEAIEHYRRTLELRPDTGKVHNNLGTALLREGRKEEAFGYFEEAVRREPRSAVARDNLAGLLRERGRLEEALAQHAEACRLDPHWGTARNNLGATLRAAGRHAEALRAFEEALRLDPELAEAHLNAALSHSMAGREEEARRHYREARRLRPSLPALD